MEVMSARDISRYLKINEKKIYKLAQESRIPFMKIGGKVVFVRELIDKWILEGTERDRQIYIAGSDDMLLRNIIDVYNKAGDGLVFYAPIGSMNGLKALKDRGATLSCVHIFDTEKREYNVSYLHKYLGTEEYVVVQLFLREQGIYVRKGNPEGITSLEDIRDKGALFVNRNRGSGTRLLIDYLLQEARIDPSGIKGYEVEAETHLQVGLSVIRGDAEAGFGIRYVAHLMGLDFIPLFEERFDLVIPEDRYYNSLMTEFLAFFEPQALLHHVRDFTGYNMENTGRVLFPRG
jgi:excisionase family DNA binding protein